MRPPYDGLRVVGARWSPESYAAKEFLSRSQVPYQWIDIDQDPAMRELLASLSDAEGKLPVLLFADGTHLVAPTRAELAERCGMQTRATRPFYDMVIVGAGPAGLAAAGTVRLRGCGPCWSSRARQADKPGPVPGSRTISDFPPASAAQTSPAVPRPRRGASAPKCSKRRRPLAWVAKILTESLH